MIYYSIFAFDSKHGVRRCKIKETLFVCIFPSLTPIHIKLYFADLRTLMFVLLLQGTPTRLVYHKPE